MTEVSYQKLSDLISKLPEAHKMPYLRLFMEAVEREKIDAVPNEGNFTVGKKSCRDLTFEAAATFEEWHTQTLRSVELKLKRRGVVVHSEDVAAGRVDFKAKARAFRQEIKKRKSRAKLKASPAKLEVRVGVGEVPESGVEVNGQQAGGVKEEAV